jgi:acetyl-CoA synthetase
MTKLYPVPADFAARARIRHDDYVQLYRESMQDPEEFWGRMAARLQWMQPFKRVKDVSFDARDFRVRWYEGGQLNVSQNCLDRHLAQRADKTAIIYEGDDPSVSGRITYRELYERVCRCANALRELGVTKGDRITIYLPMIPDAAVAMLACARIGAIHSVVFGGFSPDSLAGRIADCASTVVITAGRGRARWQEDSAQGQRRPGAFFAGTDTVKHVLVIRHTGANVPMYRRDRWYDDVVRGRPAACEPVPMDSEDPLFILYTSGSTGKPKGRAAHDRRLSRLRVADSRDGFRPARERCVLVHRGRRLGDGAQLRRLRPACKRRDHADVRRCAELS